MTERTYDLSLPRGQFALLIQAVLLASANLRDDLTPEQVMRDLLAAIDEARTTG